MKYTIEEHNQKRLDLKNEIKDNRKKAHDLIDKNKKIEEKIKKLPYEIFAKDIERAKKRIIIFNMVLKNDSKKDILKIVGKHWDYKLRRYIYYREQFGEEWINEQIRDAQLLIDGFIKY